MSAPPACNGAKALGVRRCGCSVLLSGDYTLSLHALRAGMGVGFLTAWLLDGDLADGPLQRVLPQWNALTVTLYAIYTSRLSLAPKLRSFMDWVVTELGG